MKVLGVIPARYGSTRLPAKALALIANKPMIQHVYEQVIQCKSIDYLIVATDNALIYETVKAFGGNAIMTSTEHTSGTERCAEVAEKIGDGFDFIINIQGDEPFIQPQQIQELISLFSSKIAIATLARKITSTKTLFDPNSPKLVFNEVHEALYFSRQVIPFLRDIPRKNWLKEHGFYEHIGIYGFRTDTLKAIAKLPVSALESAEKLEQLRWLAHGFKIKVGISKFSSFSIDTLRDLEKANKYFNL